MKKNFGIKVPGMVILIIAIFIPSTTSLAFVCGDVNTDGNINLLDILYIIDHLYGSPTGNAPMPCDVGDVNNDRSLNLLDILHLTDHLYGNPPGPEPNCVAGAGTVIDIDGTIYLTVLIGNQCWMAENLKVTHYQNGDPIPIVTADTVTWYAAYFEYDNDTDNVAVYGRLYNGYAVEDSRNIAPAGWHVPSDDEWKQLEMCLGMLQSEADFRGWRGTYVGGKLKETGTMHWISPNVGATNESGFNSLPGGCRGNTALFDGMGIYANYWSSTERSSGYTWYRLMQYDNSEVLRNYFSKHAAGSVRCVRD